MVWLREKNPWKSPTPDMPHLPEGRPRPLTASSECQGSKETPFFTNPPKEIRLEILRQAIGGNDIHVELDDDYPATLRKPPVKNHTSRMSLRYETQEMALVELYDPSYHRCKFGVKEWCKSTPGEVPSKCHVGAMGWLLFCRQAYQEGIQVLYSTNAFLLSNTELILNLPKLLLPSRLESMTRVEMLWRIHPFREQQEQDPPLSDFEAFLKLTVQTPVIFPKLKMLYISLLGDMYAAEGDTHSHQNYATEYMYRNVEQVVMKPIEDKIKKFSLLSTCIIALPSSYYGAEKRHALENGGKVLEKHPHKAERLWRELRNAPALDGIL
ncbi:hypothetical protein BHE90_012172 [Fusarium euwallaceae]|uniref:DUF7730 domain-containing protein n=1 Tax=Fusarium euwallaceae TaxID=1147111 RepID=A0A430LCD4_9HYPO|nr:hypothetical protein BHE90_012172 [Fusarium euwallaceae]